MPFYDYKCSKCEKVFEVQHSMTESPDINCPECQNKASKLITSSVGISFKGPGFYVNDSKNSSSNSSASSKGKSSSSSAK